MAFIQTFEALAAGQPEITGNVLTCGPIQFQLTPDWSTVQKTALQRLFTLTYPRLEHYLGQPVTTGTWQLELKRDDRTARASCYGREQRLVLQPYLPPWVVVHELGHVFHGARTTHFDFFCEGIAQAVAELVCEDCDLRSMNDRRVYDLGKNTALAKRTPFDRSHWNRFNFLLGVRTVTAAAVWKSAEQSRPGFMRTFHERWKAIPQIEVGPDKVTDFAPAQLREAIAHTETEHSIAPLTHHERLSQKGASKLLPDGTIQRPVILAYADPHKDIAHVCGAVLRHITMTIEGLAQPLCCLAEVMNAHVPMQVRARGLNREGAVRRELRGHITTAANGTIALSLPELREKLGNFQRYQLDFTASGALSEQLTLNR